MDFSIKCVNKKCNSNGNEEENGCRKFINIQVCGLAQYERRSEP